MGTRYSRHLRAFCLLLVAVVCGLGTAGAASAMPRIRVHDGVLDAGDRPFRAFGFNWGVGDRHAAMDYLDDPSPARLAVARAQLATAAGLGADALRIPVELGQVMAGPDTPRRHALRALRRLLVEAQADGIYLDITGDVDWRPSRVPAWYDRLPLPARWQVQARFWDAVAAAVHRSDAVLCFELTSEPLVPEDTAGGWYRGAFGGYTFGQAIGFARGRASDRLARRWTDRMASAVRAHDDRPVTIGLLPDLKGPFRPANVADLLDLVTVHVYPSTGRARDALAVVRAAARSGRPVLLGETMALLGNLPTERRFLRRAAPLTCGVLGFFDGRGLAGAHTSSLADALYFGSLRQLVDLRPWFSAGRRA